MANRGGAQGLIALGKMGMGCCGEALRVGCGGGPRQALGVCAVRGDTNNDGGATRRKIAVEPGDSLHLSKTGKGRFCKA